MGIEDEADRTLFIRNLDTRVTEEILFDLFVKAGPLVKTKIPKDVDGKQKSFGFAVYKHEVSVPYAMKLTDGITLYGRTIHVQYRSGSSHSNSPGNSQNTSPANTQNLHGQRTPSLFSSPPYTPPTLMQRSFSSPDNLQKHVMMNNMMWLQMQQQQQQQQQQQPEQANDGFSKHAGGSFGSRQHDSAPYRHSSQPTGGRNHRYAEEPFAGSRHQQHGQSRDSYHHHQNDRSGNRHHGNRGGNRHHDDKGSNRDYQDNRWRRY